MLRNPLAEPLTFAADNEPPRMKATPFVWVPEADIPPRRWLYGKHLLRKFVSLDIAAGGIGKSSLKIGEALAMTSGRSIYGKECPEGKLRVWIYNLEDPDDETQRRLHAAAKYFRITPDECEGRLFVDSGRDQQCVIAEETPNGARIIRPMVNEIIREINERQIDCLILDPFVSSHQINENDNRAMDMVAKEWASIADTCDCSINLVHHVRKANGMEATAESARGASSLVGAARSVVVYNRMTKEEAEKAGISPEQASFYFRTQNDKANLSPPESADWHRMNNVDLDNGDSVGVACPWTWPDAFEGIATHKVMAVQRAVSEGDYRQSPQAKDWVGTIIATVLGMDLDDAKDKARIKTMIGTWLKNDVLRVVEKPGPKRDIRQFIEVGIWITE